MRLRALAKRLHELEAGVSASSGCRGCQDSCPRADSCPVWCFRALLTRLEAERRVGRPLIQAREALNELVRGDLPGVSA